MITIFAIFSIIATLIGSEVYLMYKNYKLK